MVIAPNETSNKIYPCQVFHNALPKYLSEVIEKLQRRALRIIYPRRPYSDVPKEISLSRFSVRRQHSMSKLFSEIAQDPTHRLRSLLPPENNCRYQLYRKTTIRGWRIPMHHTKVATKNNVVVNYIALQFTTLN